MALTIYIYYSIILCYIALVVRCTTAMREIERENEREGQRESCFT